MDQLVLESVATTHIHFHLPLAVLHKLHELAEKPLTAVFLDPEVIVPAVVRSKQAEINKTWKGYKPKDLDRARNKLAPLVPTNAAASVLDYWLVSEGNVFLDETPHQFNEVESEEDLPELGAGLLQHHGQGAFQSLVQSAVGTTCTATFPVKFDGAPAICVVRLKAHASLQDQSETRARWCRAGRLPLVELNPSRQQFTTVTAMVASHRPRNWGTLQPRRG